MSEGSVTDSVADNESQDGADGETDDEDRTYFDTNEFLYSDALRCASYRSREGMGNASIFDRDYICYDGVHGFDKEIKDVSYPYLKRRVSCLCKVQEEFGSTLGSHGAKHASYHRAIQGRVEPVCDP